MDKKRLTFQFVNPDNPRGFRLAILAFTIGEARAHVRSHGNVLAYRGLRYAGKGEPSSTDGWVAAMAHTARARCSCASCAMVRTSEMWL